MINKEELKNIIVEELQSNKIDKLILFNNFGNDVSMEARTMANNYLKQIANNIIARCPLKDNNET